MLPRRWIFPKFVSVFLRRPVLCKPMNLVTRSYNTGLNLTSVSSLGTLHKDSYSLSKSRNLTHDEQNPRLVLYRWPTMKHFRFISRFKVYQVCTMMALLPPMSYWYHTGIISAKVLTLAYLSAGATTALLSILSYYFTRVVGELAISRGQLQVSTLTFLGGRRDLLFSLDQIIPFSDSNSNTSAAIQRLELTGADRGFLYSLRYGRVLNQQLLYETLGIQL